MALGALICSPSEDSRTSNLFPAFSSRPEGGDERSFCRIGSGPDRVEPGKKPRTKPVLRGREARLGKPFPGERVRISIRGVVRSVGVGR